MTTGSTITRIVIADHQPLFRIGLHALLDAEPDIEIIAEAWNAPDAVRLVRELDPDVLILDLATPTFGGLQVLRELTGKRTKVITFASAISRDAALIALRRGVMGVLRMDCAPETVMMCIRSVAAGEHWIGRDVLSDLLNTLPRSNRLAGMPRPYSLTSRESEVLELIVAGNTNKDIAQQFNVSTDTIKHHLTNIFDKTGVSNRLELAMFAIHHGLAGSV